MLIKTLDLRNFQAHKNLSLKFSRYLTVIKGTSGVGKSAILRSLFQLIDEAIPWGVCHTWDTDNTAIKLVGMSDGKECTIERVHSTKTNRVIIDGKTYDYVGKDTPAMLSSKLNIKEQNIQKQKNHWFLIDMKPSQLSRELNSVSGLNIIDASIHEIASRVRNAQTELRLLTSQASLLDKEVNALYYVEQADVDLRILEEAERKVLSLEKRRFILEEKHRQLTGYLEQKKNVLPPNIEQDLEALKTAYRRFREAENTHGHCLDCRDMKKQFDYLLDSAKSTYKKLRDAFEDIPTSFHKYMASKQQCEELSNILEQLNTLSSAKKSAEKALKLMTKIKSEIKVCPVCGGLLCK